MVKTVPGMPRRRTASSVLSIVVTIGTLYDHGCRSNAIRWSSSSSSSAFAANARSLERRSSTATLHHRAGQSSAIIPRSRGSSGRLSSNVNNDEMVPMPTNKSNSQQPPRVLPFSLSTALFLAGLAFDTYVEDDDGNAARWA